MRLIVLLFSFLCVSEAFAGAISLKCIDSSGQAAADLHVDLAEGELRWSIVRYRITQQSDRYISATQVTSPDEVGGEIWVLDRITGEYTRASVSILATEFSEGRPVDPRLAAVTYSGVCKLPVL